MSLSNIYFRTVSTAIATSEEKENHKEESLNSKNAPSKRSNKAVVVVSWDEGKVNEFLLKHNLTSMLPLLSQVNGEELYDLYDMCNTNAASMYRSLRFELLHHYGRILPISHFLRFMSRMRAVCENVPASSP